MSESITSELTAAAVQVVGKIDCDSTPAQVAEVINQLDSWADAIKEARAMLNEAIYEWLNQNDGAQLVVGTKKYYIGTTVSKKANNNGSALTALFEATGGDLEAVAECISSGASAWKFAKCKQTLGDDAYKEQFLELVKKDVKGEKVKSLENIDTRFIH